MICTSTGELPPEASRQIPELLKRSIVPPTTETARSLPDARMPFPPPPLPYNWQPMMSRSWRKFVYVPVFDTEIALPVEDAASRTTSPVREIPYWSKSPAAPMMTPLPKQLSSVFGPTVIPVPVIHIALPQLSATVLALMITLSCFDRFVTFASVQPIPVRVCPTAWQPVIEMWSELPVAPSDTIPDELLFTIAVAPLTVVPAAVVSVTVVAFVTALIFDSSSRRPPPRRSRRCTCSRRTR
jgi:hypothetical protein